MIPDIGLMVGLYITTRMVDLVFADDAHVVGRICAGLTIVVALFCMMDLLSKGSSAHF
jgi:hypothetical protein